MKYPRANFSPSGNIKSSVVFVIHHLIHREQRSLIRPYVQLTSPHGREVDLDEAHHYTLIIVNKQSLTRSCYVNQVLKIYPHNSNSKNAEPKMVVSG